MAQESIILSEIKNKDDLKKILKFLDNQGFGITSVQHPDDYTLNNYKINKIIDNANILNIKINNRNNLFSELSKLNNYSDMVTTANNYFSKFNSKDKIKEFIDIFYIQEDEYCKVPSHTYPGKKEIIEWFNFKTKYDLNDDYNDNVYYYNLDKNFLKIKFGDNKYEFEKFYKLLYNEESSEFEHSKYGKNIYGTWINLGKIEIKFFQTGNVNIKGDLASLREYYYEYLTSKNNNYTNYIIKYNGKIEIIKAKKEV